MINEFIAPLIIKQW